jgi:hypothetical protein
VNERGIIGVVENHNQVIVGNEYKKSVKLSESRLFYASNL